MVVVKCPLCDFETEDLDIQIVAAVLNIHAIKHTQQASASQPKLERPKIDAGVEEEVWNGFVRRWEAFRVGSGISDSTASMQLFQCASESLGDLLLKADPDIHNKPIKDVMSVMRTFAVIPVAIGVRRAELMQLRQEPDELFRTFAARVKGKAETCNFSTTSKCQCGKAVKADYTTESVRDVLLAGIADLDIRREALSMNDIQSKSINDVIAFVEGREMARNATPSTLSALSSFKKRTKNPKETSHTATCPDCKKQFQAFKQRPNGSWNVKPFTKCLSCWRAGRHKPSEESPKSLSASALSSDPDVVHQISALESIRPDSLISKNDFKRTIRRSDHPRVKLGITMKNSNKTKRCAQVLAVADSGAMSNLWSLDGFLASGNTVKDLTRVSTDIRAANKLSLNIIGYFDAVIEGKSSNGSGVFCVHPVYVSDSVSEFYLSYDTMLDLGILDRCFPSVGQFTPPAETQNCAGITGKSCDCPQREPIPPMPQSLPFCPTAENNDKMRDWLLKRYGKSTFNTCPHKPLPSMTGPPIEIHIDESAKPKTCHTAAPIPLHWQEQVHKDLIRDEALGVIEKVPYGEPVTWCHRMVVTRKHDGSPRRTVDLSPLNKFCKRETFATEAPFPLARRVPGMTWKTVADAWNGYHSVPLRESDRHLTTFITPFGRWRYTRAPQGFLSSGDGYNRRVDAILSDFERKERCVDDTVFYDDELETHWWRTIKFLSTCGAAGIVLNPDKFQFAQREVDFAGFRITESKIQPLPKYIEAILSFPTPTSTTDIRSWFGLINRVANYAQLREELKLFKPFLSPRHQFFWSPVLDKAFENSKRSIVNAILKGVEIFDMSRPTCLRPDWSKEGIGYFLLQKHCTCESELPECCANGWKITLAGSRFLRGPEQRYAAIEGEALAIVWGLEQTKYFTQGCSNLLVVTDHKPLKKIFGDRTLDEISNTRLFRLKQRTLPWFFRIEHMPGVTNDAADVMSRYPSKTTTDMETRDLNDEEHILAGICRDVEDVSTISWDLIAAETMKDEILTLLIHSLNTQMEGSSVPKLSEYGKYYDSLYVHDGVILYNDRVLIPKSIRNVVLENLHSAHQGVSTMERRAYSIVFWPGMAKDILQFRANCTDCNINVPSIPSHPSFHAV